jgi:hypothetical protein
MPNKLQNNAYHVLGLDITVSQKKILQRSKEIIKRLRIDDTPKYDVDINIFNGFRTEKSVIEATHKLQNPKKQIRDFFFWFQIDDDDDELALKSIKSINYNKALQVWKTAAKEASKKIFSHKKNLAIFYLVLLTQQGNKRYLKDSVAIWESLFKAKDFWPYFSKNYELHCEQAGAKTLVDNFKKQATTYLADIYTGLYHSHKNPDYINEFQKIFKTKGVEIEKDLLSPIYNSINAIAEELEEMKVSEDGILDEQEKKDIKRYIGLIQLEFNKLIDFGLYDDAQTKVMRDRAANAIKTIVLDLHNNLSETDMAIALLNTALKIAGTSSLATKIQDDIALLKEIKNENDTLNPISNLINDKKYEEALNLIKVDKIKHQSNYDLQKIYSDKSKECVFSMGFEKYKQAMDYFNNKQHCYAKPLFAEAGNIIYSNIGLFNFNKEGIDEIIADIKKSTAKFDTHKDLDAHRNSLIQLAKEKFEGECEETILIVLIDSYFFGGVSNMLEKYTNKMKTVNTLYTIGWITVWFWGIGLIFFLIAWIYESRD